MTPRGGWLRSARRARCSTRLAIRRSRIFFAACADDQSIDVAERTVSLRADCCTFAADTRNVLRRSPVRRPLFEGSSAVPERSRRTAPASPTSWASLRATRERERPDAILEAPRGRRGTLGRLDLPGVGDGC